MLTAVMQTAMNYTHTHPCRKTTDSGLSVCVCVCVSLCVPLIEGAVMLKQLLKAIILGKSFCLQNSNHSLPVSPSFPSHRHAAHSLLPQPHRQGNQNNTEGRGREARSLLLNFNWLPLIRCHSCLFSVCRYVVIKGFYSLFYDPKNIHFWIILADHAYCIYLGKGISIFFSFIFQLQHFSYSKINTTCFTQL